MAVNFGLWPPQLCVGAVRIHFKLFVEVRVDESDCLADHLFDTVDGFLMERFPFVFL